MNILTNYNELKDTLSKNSYKISERYTYLEKAVDSECILASYGKNIFDKTANQELYLIAKTKFFVVTWDPFVMKTYRTKDIIDIELILKSCYEISMKINLSNGVIIELDNKKDCNEDWQEEYYEYILQVNKTLTSL